jgi:hypothetical protein
MVVASAGWRWQGPRLERRTVESKSPRECDGEAQGIHGRAEERDVVDECSACTTWHIIIIIVVVIVVGCVAQQRVRRAYASRRRRRVADRRSVDRAGVDGRSCVVQWRRTAIAVANASSLSHADVCRQVDDAQLHRRIARLRRQGEKHDVHFSFVTSMHFLLFLQYVASSQRCLIRS